MNGPTISFIGNITRDPGEMRYSRNGGTAYLTIGVAVNTRLGPDEPALTNYFNATLFGRPAENALSRWRRGDQVFIQGNYRLRSYERQDGSTGFAQDVSVREFHHFPRGEARAQPQAGPEQDGRDLAGAGTQPAEQPSAQPAAAPPQETAKEDQAGHEVQANHGGEEVIDFGEPINMEEVEPGDPFGEEIPAGA